MSLRYTRRAFGTALGGLVGAAGFATGRRVEPDRAESVRTERTATESTWPTFRGSAGSAAAVDATSPTTDVAEAWEWAPSSDATVGVPVVGDDAVYACLEPPRRPAQSGDSTAAVVALDRADGTVRWRRDVAGTTRLSVPTVEGDTAYVVGGDATVYALDVRDGAVRDATPFGETTRDWFVPVPPRVVDGTLYAAAYPWSGGHPSCDAVLAAIGVDGCGASWTMAVEGADGLGARLEAPAVSGGRVFVVGRAGRAGFVRAVSAATGETEWERSGADADWGTSPPVAVDGTVYAVTETGSLTALDDADGTERWRYRAPDEIRSPPAVTAEAVYVVSNVVGGLSMDPPYGAVVAALDPDTGTRLWSREAPSTCGAETNPDFPECDIVSTEWSRPSVGKGAVYTSLDRFYGGAGSAGVRALSPADGELLWEYELTVRHAPVLAGSALYLVDAAGGRRLVKLAAAEDGGQ